jgi:hypothetical protein
MDGIRLGKLGQMIYRIMAEGHEGVFSVDEEWLDTVEADSEQQALEIYAAKHEVKRCPEWNCYWIGRGRRLSAVHLGKPTTCPL